MRINRILQKTFSILNLEVQRKSSYVKKFKEIEQSRNKDFEFLSSMPYENLTKLINIMPRSKSQLRQDLFVLSQLNFKENGYFVEFGATNGIELSNTYLLEKEFGWRGILAEPARIWKRELLENRNGPIEDNCVWSKSDCEIKFLESSSPELSTITNFKSLDLNKKIRKTAKTYSVRTISLNDLLSKHGAPDYIDYLSIDTEGSEYEILKELDFSKYSIGVITCEHNFTTNRELIFELLTSHSYRRVLTNLSNFDDWYVKDI